MNEVSETKVKLRFCLLCQEKTGHKTQNCPSIICKRCGQSGHPEIICQNQPPQPKVWSGVGRVAGFSQVTKGGKVRVGGVQGLKTCFRRSNKEVKRVRKCMRFKSQGQEVFATDEVVRFELRDGEKFAHLIKTRVENRIGKVKKVINSNLFSVKIKGKKRLVKVKSELKFLPGEMVKIIDTFCREELLSREIKVVKKSDQVILFLEVSGMPDSGRTVVSQIGAVATKEETVQTLFRPVRPAAIVPLEELNICIEDGQLR